MASNLTGAFDYIQNLKDEEDEVFIIVDKEL